MNSSTLTVLFYPNSIAIIGASNRPLTIGYRISQNLKDAGFKGAIYPVHPKESEINGLKAYPSILAVPETPDLAHIVVKNSMVPQVIEDCGKKGVKCVIINTAGFKETGGDGIELEKQIVSIAKKYNVRIFGPNCQGVINSDPSAPLYANFTYTRITKPGNISIIAQSGGVGEVINQRLAELGTGIRMYASNGNAADISIPEILSYWAEDKETRVIILHIESLAQPAEFIRIASAITRHKPILGMKTGRTAMGARAVSSHTGSLMKADTAIDAVFDKCGIIPFTNQEDICQAALAFATQPVPKGLRVGIITNTGGPGIIATDECVLAGLSIPDLSENTKTFLKANLFPEATVSNPVDVLATAGPKEYAAAIDALLKEPNVDSVMVNFITPFFVDCEGVAKEIKRLAENTSKPLLSVVMTDKKQWAETLETIKSAGLPAYDLPETASKALSAMVQYGLYRQRPQAPPPVFTDVDKVRAQSIILSAQKAGRKFLSAKDGFELLKAYKIPVAKFALEETTDACLKSADRVGYPLVLKVDSETVVHKSDQGGVITGIKNSVELAGHLKEFQKRFNGVGVKYMIQEYIGAEESGQCAVAGRQKPAEVILGASFMEGLGHLMMFGLGGIFVEVLKDVSFRIAPLTEYDARGMAESIKSAAVLKGVRGRKSAAMEKLTEITLRLSQLLTDCPGVVELDLNPVMMFPEAEDCKVVDVRIEI
ncbi:MAG: acetate--CoA ligase family protein [Planctomycetes bacterium]|nr:acetate--CoA ligase family protein [Planctomycetota bacterium]